MYPTRLCSLHSLSLPLRAPTPLPPTKRQLFFRARCSSSNSEEADPSTRGTDGLVGFVGERVEELLRREENRGLVEGLNEASRRVDKARAELENMRRQRDEAVRAREYMRQLENQQAEVGLFFFE